MAWLVFSVPHFSYHLAHLQALAPLDAVAQPISLALSLVLSIPLVVPPRRRGTDAVAPDASGIHAAPAASVEPTAPTTEEEHTR